MRPAQSGNGNVRPSSARGVALVRKLPLLVTISIASLAPDVSGKSLVEFVLTNSGSSDIVLPTSPHPGDFEPSDPKLPYTVMRLGLGISLVKKPGVIFPGGAELFGNRAVLGSLTTLAAGASIRVLARVELPGARNSAESFDAIASLDNETMKTTDGKLVSDSQNVGFATSRPYTLDALFRVHD